MGKELKITTLQKLDRICDLLDENPEAWPVYSDTFRMALDGAMALIEQNAKYLTLAQHAPINRFGKPMTRGGRAQNCKRWAWDNKPHVCEECGIELTRAIMTPHHIVPVSAGGDDSPENLIVLCANCHAERHNKSKYDD